jgi:tRNA nucleotidyltransferase (CCA-adding enzyme)
VKVFKVGGAVRDRLLGLPVTDRDWVVVGATAEALEAEGFRRVGRDFPVFLHPETREEYALARRERKVGPGYTGFVFEAGPEVSLDEDLQRRDLTINAMAETPEGEIIDPWGGRADLAARLLRHVSPAFAEDPVRILRTARFAARLGWAVAPATLALMRRMVAAGEVDALVPERVWAEWQRALAEPHPERFLAVLADCGALARLWPELARLLAGPEGETAQACLAAAVARGADAPVRHAALLHPLAEHPGGDPAADREHAPGARGDEAELRPLVALLARMRAPRDYQDLSLLAARHARALADCRGQDGECVWAAIQAGDGLRRPERFRQLAEVAATRAGAGADADVLVQRLTAALRAARAVDAARLAGLGLTGPALGPALAAARQAAVATCLGAFRGDAPETAG